VKDTFCPATMCPLFAAGGSPWTGHKNSHCEGEACGFYHQGHCEGAGAAIDQVMEARTGRRPFQLAVVTEGRRGVEYIGRDTKTFDCSRAATCQWQVEAGDKLCPPRAALALGVDPRACGY
jgi:hypothetical protein